MPKQKEIITSEYWKDRQQVYFKNLEKDEKKLMDKLEKEYSKQAKELDKEVASYYAKYGKDNVIEYKDLLVKLDPAESKQLMQNMDRFFDKNPDLNHLKPIRESVYKLDRADSLRFDITRQQIEIGIMEEKALRDHLKENYVNTYNGVANDLGLKGSFLKIDDQTVRNLVNEKWLQDKNFSDNLWANKEKLIDYMHNDFKTGIIRGDNYAKLGKTLKERFNKRSASDIKRLVYTEGTFVANQAMANPFMDMGYRSYYFDAILDERTSDTCEGLDGTEFDFADMEAGENFPPMHAYCRSSFTINTDNIADPETAGEPEVDPVEDDAPEEMGYTSTKEAFKSVSYRGIDKEYAKEIDAQLLDLQNKYPINAGNISIKTQKSRNSFGHSRGQIVKRTRKGDKMYFFEDEIVLSNVHNKTKEISLKTHLYNYESRGSKLKTDMATIDHEYGHAVDNYYLLMKDKALKKQVEEYRKGFNWTESITTREEARDTIREINDINGSIYRQPAKLSSEMYAEMKKHYELDNAEMHARVVKELGTYAGTNEAEFLAEGFTNVRHLPKEDKTDFINKFEEVFDRKFKEVIRNGSY